MTSNSRHGLPPRLMAHLPTRFTAAQESKPSPSPGIRMTPCCDHPRSTPWCPTPLLRFGGRRYAFAMLQGRTRQGYGRPIIAALLAYELALHLIGAGLVGAAHAAQSPDPQALLDPHALCVPGGEGASPVGGRPDPGDPHDH